MEWITNRIPTSEDADDDGDVTVPRRPGDDRTNGVPGIHTDYRDYRLVSLGQEWWPKNLDAAERAESEENSFVDPGMTNSTDKQPKTKPGSTLDFPNDPMAQAELEELRAKTLMWKALAFRISKSDHALYINLPRF